MMHAKLLLLLSVMYFAAIGVVHAQAKKFDTTMKIGKVGYRVSISNKNPAKNNLTISPEGFGNQMREFSFEVKGRIRKAEVDDLNRDGFPDLVLYVYGADSLNKGTVIGISSEKNESVVPIFFPDIVDDLKLKDGYKGFDEFLLMEGMLIRRFPLYSADSTQAAPIGKMRQVMYRVVPNEKGGLKFQVMRNYDYNKQ